MKKFFSYLLLFLTSTSVGLAQSTEIEMADGLRSSGKIYVVVVVVTIILSGLFIYLIGLDKKINKLEKQLNAKKGDHE